MSILVYIKEKKTIEQKTREKEEERQREREKIRETEKKKAKSLLTYRDYQVLYWCHFVSD